jgi:HlyD family secretion protein
MSRHHPPAAPAASAAAGPPLPGPYGAASPPDPTPASPAILAGWATAVLLLLGFGGWSVSARLDGAIVVQGHLAAGRAEVRVQHPEGGRVVALLVSEGEAVKPGQPLVRLDDGLLAAERAIVEDQLAAARARHARLEAERDAIPDLAAAVPDAHLDGQRRLLAARRAALALERDALASRRTQAQAQRAGLMAQRAALDAEIAAQAEDLAQQQRLTDAGALPSARLAVPRREALRLQGARATLSAEIAAIDARIAEVALQSQTLQARHLEEVETALRDLAPLLIELAARRAALADRIDRLTLRAPAAGRVHGLLVAWPGAVLRPAEPVAQIVADGPALVARLPLRPDDIDRVLSGQPVRLLLPATGGRERPDLPGRIALISADAVEDPRSGQRHFVVEVALDPGAFALPDGRVLRAGLPVEGHIHTGVRTPMAWLMAPLMVYFDRALREG